MPGGRGANQTRAWFDSAPDWAGVAAGDAEFEKLQAPAKRQAANVQWLTAFKHLIGASF